jgi:hypothetical protein
MIMKTEKDKQLRIEELLLQIDNNNPLPKPHCEHNGVLHYKSWDKLTGEGYCCLEGSGCAYYKEGLKNDSYCLFVPNCFNPSWSVQDYIKEVYKK